MGRVEFKDGTSVKKTLGPVAFIVMAVILLAGGKIAGDFIAKQTMPHRYAQAHQCRAPEPETNGVYFANICDKPVNLRYCLYVDNSTDPSLCKTEYLAPGKGAPDYITDRMAVKNEAGEGSEISRVDIWSCFAPFEPAIVSDLNKRGLKIEGCSPLDADSIGE